MTFEIDYTKNQRPATESEPTTERSPLDVASAFLGDHQVVELLKAGAEPIFTVSVLLEGEFLRVIPTVHKNDDPETVLSATYSVLNACRLVIDKTAGEGEAVKALFCMATNPETADGGEVDED